MATTATGETYAARVKPYFNGSSSILGQVVLGSKRTVYGGRRVELLEHRLERRRRWSSRRMCSVCDVKPWNSSLIIFSAFAHICVASRVLAGEKGCVAWSRRQNISQLIWIASRISHRPGHFRGIVFWMRVKLLRPRELSMQETKRKNPAKSAINSYRSEITGETGEHTGKERKSNAMEPIGMLNFQHLSTCSNMLEIY